MLTNIIISWPHNLLLKPYLLSGHFLCKRQQHYKYKLTQVVRNKAIFMKVSEKNVMKDTQNIKYVKVNSPLLQTCEVLFSF